MRRVITILGLLFLTGMASPYWLSAGLQADWLSQGLSFRVFHKNGLGLHLSGRWFNYNLEGSDVTCELRVEKMFQMPRRVRPYVGLGFGGGFGESGEFFGFASVLGVDVIIMQARKSADGLPSHGLSLNVELMLGAFAHHWGPAAGAGLHYNW